MSGKSIVPVVLSGGAGARLWPLSRQLRPKQFLTTLFDRSLFADTLNRVRHDQFSAPLIVCNDQHRFLVGEELRANDMECNCIISEPVSRNTASAVAVAAVRLVRSNPDSLMLVLPSDLVIGGRAEFHHAVGNATSAADNGYFMTFGINATQPETGYGYIEVGDSLQDYSGCNVVRSFVEKPEYSRAQDFVRSGNYLWNSGMYLVSPLKFLEELGHLNPEMMSTVKSSMEAAECDSLFVRLDEELYSRVPSLSVDVAVMEKTHRGGVVRTDMGWSDVGAWPAVYDVGTKNEDGNVIVGDVLTSGAANSYLYSDHGLVAAIDVEDLVVVATDDAVLVSSKKNAQNVRTIVDQIKRSSRGHHFSHTTVYRPWGSYRNLNEAEGYLTKEIVVKPGEKLSLQYHHHRAEHWIVVEGCAVVTNGDDVIELQVGESTYIPVGTTHRLENPGKGSLRLIEVQVGSYIGEDDIVRVADDYGRD